jgi:predicted ATPase
MVYAWEDLHWADPSTLELLTLLLAQVPTTRLLAVLTFRPEFIPPGTPVRISVSSL